MRRLIAVTLAFVASSAIAQARIVGLVEIPALHSGVNETGSSVADRALAPVTLYAEPTYSAAAAFVVRERRELESLEHDYEQVSAVVSEVRGADFRVWYRLRFDARGQSGYGWLREEDAGGYRPAHSLVMMKGLTYLTKSWDGRLFEAPRIDAPTTSLSKPTDNQDVRILDSYDRNSDGSRWYLVVLVSGSCAVEPLEIVGHGWVPEYSDSGNNTLWFYSRGC